MQKLRGGGGKYILGTKNKLIEHYCQQLGITKVHTGAQGFFLDVLEPIGGVYTLNTPLLKRI